MPPFLRIIIAPTASGKEKTALACARAMNAQIVSVDSMKIYRGLDVGTAKAGEKERAEVPHHCLDIADPQEEFSVASYIEHATDAIADIAAHGSVPVLSGGTALYYKGLLEGLFEGPSADLELREELLEFARECGVEALHERLKELDPQTAERVHFNDVRRVVRALEVVTITGKPISKLQTQWEDEGGEAREYLYPCCMVGLMWPREILHRRIGQRVDRMLDMGLEKEARFVYENRESFSRTPLQAVGYKEFFGYFSGECSLDEAVELLKRNTRRLGKSQMTWFRKFPCKWVEMREGMTADDAAAEVMRIWGEAQG